MPRIQLYGFIFLSMVLALGLSWMVDTGLFFVLLVVLVVATIWLGMSCYGLQQQLQAIDDARTLLLQILSERAQLTQKVMDMALKFDEYGALAHELTRISRDSSGAIANSSVELDRNVKLSVDVLEKHLDSDRSRRYRQIKLELATSKTEVAKECRTYNEIATKYNASLEKPPMKWLRRKLAFVHAPRFELSDKRSFGRLQRFSNADGPLLRDCLNTIGKPLCSIGAKG